MARDLDYTTLSAALDYDPTTGVLTWRIRPPFSKLSAGDVAGWVSGKGRRYIRIGQITYTASRVAWILHHKAPIPDGMQIDHKNTKRNDDRIDNLRLATASQNLCNRSGRGSSGLKGVSLHKTSGLWVAKIRADKVRHHLGYFQTAEEAHAAYKAAAQILHGEFART